MSRSVSLLLLLSIGISVAVALATPGPLHALQTGLAAKTATTRHTAGVTHLQAGIAAGPAYSSPYRLPGRGL
jgi:hypothetical protein